MPHVHDLDVFVTVLFSENSPSVRSLEVPCECVPTMGIRESRVVCQRIGDLHLHSVRLTITFWLPVVMWCSGSDSNFAVGSAPIDGILFECPIIQYC